MSPREVRLFLAWMVVAAASGILLAYVAASALIVWLFWLVLSR